MKNQDQWTPTKYELKGAKLKGSRNPIFLTASSRLMSDITASFYQKFIPQYAKGKLADLGCGNVPFYGLYKQHIEDCICVDWPNSSHKNKFIDYEVDLNQPLPFRDKEFDTLVVSEVLEHLAEPDLFWKEMARTLKPGGHILLSVPFLYKIHEAPFDFYRYTEYALKRFATKNNLTIVTLAPFGGLPEVFADIIAKYALKIPWIGNIVCSFTQSTCSWFVKTGLGSNLSRNSAKAFPLGYFMVVGKI